MRQQFGILKKSTVEIPSGAKVSIKEVGMTDGYDGHSLRAFAYFGSNMPLIRVSEGKRSFRLNQGGKTHLLLEGDELELPDGSITTVEDYFTRLP